MNDKNQATSCDDCVFYDYDEEWETYSCQMNLDEDEMVRFLTQKHQSCPYYRYYDEYKSVQKQNWYKERTEQRLLGALFVSVHFLDMRDIVKRA